MADRKTSALTELTTPADGDYVAIVDISEVADADKDKRLLWSTVKSLIARLTASVKTANYTILASEDVGVDSTGGTFTVNLKATPSAGDVAVVRDVKQNCGTTAVAIGRNGSTINGLAEDASLNMDSGVFWFVYNGTTWLFTPITSGGLDQSQVDARVVAVVPTIDADISSKAFQISNLADDTVIAFDFGENIFSGQIIISSNASVDAAGGILSFRAASSSAFCAVIAAGAGIAVGTGILTNGTSDGVDAKLNVHSHTDNKIYFKNRLGALKTFAVQIFGQSLNTQVLV